MGKASREGSGFIEEKGMGNPYKIIEPTVISFSGGRSSGYMLYKTLEANGGIPDGSMVVFANTGKEMPQTLDFVQACAENWAVNITWVELGEVTSNGVYEKGRHKGKNRAVYNTNVVNYDTASRNGEPFMHLLAARKMPPNVVARFCTSELKVRRINSVSIGCTASLVGIRADEPRRGSRIHNRMDDSRLVFCPMYIDGTTKKTVGDFWKRQAFDLALPNNNGTTDWGNCDLCFLKGKAKSNACLFQKSPTVFFVVPSIYIGQNTKRLSSVLLWIRDPLLGSSALIPTR